MTERSQEMRPFSLFLAVAVLVFAALGIAIIRGYVTLRVGLFLLAFWNFIVLATAFFDDVWDLASIDPRQRDLEELAQEDPRQRDLQGQTEHATPTPQPTQPPERRRSQRTRTPSTRLNQYQ
jgi:hypothetical protein